MAIVTNLWSSLPTALGPCVLQVTYDDADGSLVEFRLTTPVEAVVTMRRGNGASWWDARVPPGDHVRAAGGPVQNLSDIASLTVGVTHGAG